MAKDPDRISFDASVDPHNLDIGWITQPQLVALWSRRFADVKMELSQAKRRRDVTVAEVKKLVRADPKSWGLDKVTDDAVKTAVDNAPDVIADEQSVLEAQHVVDIVGGILNAIEDRRRALENLVKLYAMGYYASPRAGSEEEMEALQEMGKGGARKAKPRGKRTPVEQDDD